MKTLRFILGDQLSRSISSLRNLNRKNDVVLMVEVQEEATYVRHHQQKIALVLSAMRHFARELRAEKIKVDYVELNAKGNTGSFTGELRRAVRRHKPDCVVVTEPGEWRVWEKMKSWAKEIGIPVEIRPDERFFCSCEEFEQWAGECERLRMESFYHHMRRKTGMLMRDGKPLGGKWNYDKENRKPLPDNIKIPELRRVSPDAATRAVMKLVKWRFADHFGELKRFGWAVTRKDAQSAMKHFIRHGLPHFGDYQDAMKTGEDFLFHSALSPYLNLGLLEPREVCKAALAALKKKKAPLNCVEGFIRQILGWREYVRGLYWLRMPAYARTNFLKARRPLPEFYWSGDTEMNCLRQAIQGTCRNAYAHHIQRLMVTGNFALLAGLSPAEVEEWYLIVYADAFDWVELPNTHGMALHADGGQLGSKPYAASGAYINRMSNYCADCVFNPKVKLGPKACPFNYLYWHFLTTNKKRLKSNPRLAMPYRTLARMPAARRKEITRQAKQFLSNLK